MFNRSVMFNRNYSRRVIAKLFFVTSWKYFYLCNEWMIGEIHLSLNQIRVAQDAKNISTVNNSNFYNVTFKLSTF